MPCSNLNFGILHCTLFLWFGRTALGSIAAEGFWNTIDPNRGRQVLFWALLTGIFGLLLGQLALWVSSKGLTLPAFLGWQLLGITVCIGILMPFSGGWLFGVPGALIVMGARVSRKEAAS